MTENPTPKPSSINPRLKAAKELLASKKLELAKEQSSKSEDLEIANIEREAADTEALTELIKKHGALGENLCAVSTPGGLVVFKRGEVAAFNEFLDLENHQSHAAIRTMLSEYVVYPSVVKYEEILDTYPASVVILGGAVTRLMGARCTVVEGK